VAAAVPSSTGSVNIFVSGHSLTDNPLPDDTAAIAASLGKSTLWNQQNALGSPVRVRTRGLNEADPSFGGYRTGKNRDGANMDVAAELRNPQTLSGQRYNALVLTERHDIASTLQYEDSVRYTRHFHDRLIDGNSAATTYLYHSWFDVNKSNPAPWIAHERSAATAWQCIASRINLGLANEGRSDRVNYMPAGLALTQLVERATQGYVDGITGSSVSETMNRLFIDNVHLTRLGSYYMSLVTYVTLYKSPPSGAWAPAGISAAQARSLQDIAWAAVSGFDANPANPSMDTCQAHMRNSFCSSFYSYINRPAATASCVAHFSAQSNNNPFFFNPSSDRNYWFR
jgi:hypothetical protein